jgi:hypothetical protein
MDRELAMRAKSAGLLQVCRAVPEGLHCEILHAYDLELRDDFMPRNTDGEVSEFVCLDTDALLARIAQEELAIEAGVVALDFLLRHRAVAVSDSGIRAALDRCRPRP